MISWLSEWQKWDWAGTEYAWLGWAVLAAVLWPLLRALWGRGWSLTLHPAGQGRGQATFSSALAWLPGLLRGAGLLLLWLALMRPQTVSALSESSVQARDIFLCLDISGSMVTEDVQPNRITAAKETLKNFVRGLKGDRVGLVVFAGKAFVQCPLSLDTSVVDYFIDQVDLGTVRVDGTAIGDGLLTAVSRLVKEPGRSQVIILATDGINNAGEDPLKAAQLAAAAGVRVYTIGIGKKGGADRIVPYFGQRYRVHEEEPDEGMLTRIAGLTGGQYFRATDRDALEGIYEKIGELEKREIKVKRTRRADEHYFLFLVAGAACLAAEALLRLRIRVLA